MPKSIRVYPPPTEQIETVYEDLKLPDEDQREDPSRPYVYINMVSSLDGRVASGGKAGGIGSSTDRETMRVLRSKADAVMVGAGTLRAEKVSLTSEGRRTPEPLAVIVAGSGGVPLEENLLDAQRDGTIIVVSDSLPSETTAALSHRAHVLVSPEGSSDHRPDLVEAIRLLKSRFRVSTLLVEGGPSLNHSLVSNGLVDELFLTLAPKLIGGPPVNAESILQGDYLPNERGPHRLVSAYLSGAELFLRYSLGYIG